MSQQLSAWTAQITKTWLDTVSTGATLLDLLCTVQQRAYRDGTSQCSLIRTAEVVGVAKQLPTELLSGRQDSSLGMRRGGFEEHIPTPITQPPPSHKSLETSMVVQLTWTNG